MADKILNTRIQLKYDTLTNWQTKNTLLKQGELAIATIGAIDPANKQHPPVMFKVGPGNFNDLDWASALAADVYAWAKQDKITVTKNGTGNVVASIAWDASLNDGKGGIAYETAAVATAEGLEELQEGLEELQGALSALVEKVNGMYTNEAIDAAIADAKAGAEATAAAALAKARTEITAEIDADVKALADGAVATAQGRADDAYALAGTKADAATTYSKDDVDGLIAPLATTEALNGVKATAEQGVTDAAAAQKTADDVTARVEAFLDGEGVAETVDSLKEIQAELEALGEAVQLETQFAAKADKVANATSGNFAGLDDEGNLTDSGFKAADFATAAQGTKADSAVQSVSVRVIDPEVEPDGFILSVDGVDSDPIKIKPAGLGTAAYKSTEDFVQKDEFESELETYVHELNYQDYGIGAIEIGEPVYISGADQIKTKQTAVDETGDADQTLKISQNENGEITATPIAIQIATSQVTGLDDALGTKANDADLAAVAKSGLIDDLSIGEGTVLVFDCGGAE